MESGKTRLLEVLRLLVANPWFTGRTSTAALTRKIDRSAPSLLLDEGDPAFNGDKEYAEALRGVLNTGYRRGGAVTVCTGQGPNLDVKDFSTFCPKAIAGIGRLPDTVESRSIPIRLKKRLTREPVERFRERKARAVGQTLAEGLAMSVVPILAELESAEPELPDELSDRSQDVWEPLLALGDAAGGVAPESPRRSRALSSAQEPEDATLGVRLLADLRECFGDSDRSRAGCSSVPSRNGRGSVGGLVRQAAVGPEARQAPSPVRDQEPNRPVPRRDDGQGVPREQFEESWDRYLPVSPAQKRHTVTTALTRQKRRFSKRHNTPAVTDRNRPESA